MPISRFVLNQMVSSRSLSLLCASSLSLYAFSAQAQEYSALPEPPRAAPVISNATYYLVLVVNGQNNNQVIQVLFRDNAYFVEAGILAKNHVHLNGQQDGLVNVNALPNVTVKYDSAAQQLLLQVPDDWLPQQNISNKNSTDYTQARSSTGLLFNYDSYYSDPYQGATSVTTWMEQRLFSNAGILSNTGTWRYTSGNNDNSDVQKGYVRYDTYYRYSDEKNLISYQLGDFVSNSLTWSNSARMGGLRISRNFSVRPDLITYPLLEYSGTAAVPSTVDLFLNGNKTSSNNLNAGPFTLTNVPYINGAGEATVVTTDALGRQVSTSIPFYVSNTLLRKGLSDFDASMGAIRKNYGNNNGDYADAAFSGIFRYGVTNSLTLSSHTEIVQGMQLAGLGADVAVGNWGTLSLSGSQSRADSPPQSFLNNSTTSISNILDNGRVPINNDAVQTGNTTESKNGTQYTLGYSYYGTGFGLSALRSSRTPGYQDLTSYTSKTSLSRQSDQVTFSTSPFGKAGGSLGIGYYAIQAYDESHTRLVNMSYSLGLWGQSSMYLSLNKTIGNQGYSAQLQFIIPLDFGANINTSIQRNNSGNYQAQIGANKSTPSDGGLGWNLGYTGGNDPYQQASATWKTRYATLQGGLYGKTGEYANWAELSGSMVFIANDFFLADKVNDAFMVIDTDSYAGVSVLYENQKIGKTDKKGHLLLPNVSSYYPAKIEIDTLPLPADVIADQVSQRVSVRQGSGTIVHFPVKRVLSANITLRDSSGEPLPLGTLVTEKNSRQTSVVGYDGLVFFTNLQPHSVLSISQEGKSPCRISVDLNVNYHSIEQVGPLVCRPGSTSGENK